jgi:hypothetical protein
MYDFDHRKFDKMQLMINMNHFLSTLDIELLEKITFISYEKYHYRPDYYYEHPDVFCQILRESCGPSYVNLIESMCTTTLQDL